MWVVGARVLMSPRMCVWLPWWLGDLVSEHASKQYLCALRVSLELNPAVTFRVRSVKLVLVCFVTVGF